MSFIIASQIPVNSTEEKISEFFSFCGKVKNIEVIVTTEKTKTIKVEFEKSSAISTALLLNGAEFEGSVITVSEPEQESGTTQTTVADDSSHDESNDNDIDQESKPKSAIIAELLANGYVLQSSLVEKAIQFDQQRGISDKFNSFISNLDKKYHLQEKNKQIVDQTNTLVDQANTQWGLQSYWNNGMRTLNSYMDKFKNDKYGSQVHDFYKTVTQDVKSVNDEALRLAELKRQQQASNVSGSSAQFPVINTITPDSTTATAAGVVPFETDKK